MLSFVHVSSRYVSTVYTYIKTGNVQLKLCRLIIIYDRFFFCLRKLAKVVGSTPTRSTFYLRGKYGIKLRSF
jgi:hypothetical protein